VVVWDRCTCSTRRLSTARSRGYVGPLQGVTLATRSTTTYTFDVALASNAPVSAGKPLTAFETDLDQIDPADETGATLGDIYEYQVIVPSEISPSSPPTALIAIAAAIVLAIGGALIWRAAKVHPQPQ
jgi:hypothetical protein